MTPKDKLPDQALMLLAVAMNELRSIEAETDLVKVRKRLITLEDALTELHDCAVKANEGDR